MPDQSDRLLDVGDVLECAGCGHRRTLDEEFLIRLRRRKRSRVSFAPGDRIYRCAQCGARKCIHLTSEEFAQRETRRALDVEVDL